MLDMDQVPFLKDEVIEARADQFLQDYAAARGRAALELPIQPDAIIQNYLHVPFEIDDVPKIIAERLLKTGVAPSALPELSGTIGATFMNGAKGEIYVEQRLERDAKGRLEFTTAHEVGHWVLHRPLHLEQERQGDLFAPRAISTILCRDHDESSSEPRPRGEKQADRFAGAILAPENLVRRAFRDLIGKEPVVLGTAASPVQWSEMIRHPDARSVAKRLQRDGGFTNMSVGAMVVRLSRLGLVKGAPDESGTLAF